MPDQDAEDITKMMPAGTTSLVDKPKKSKFIWVVLACVLVGTILGVIVYQQSIKPAPVVKKPSPRPVATVQPSPTPVKSPVSLMLASPSPEPVEINVVTPVSTGSGLGGGTTTASPSASVKASATPSASPRVVIPDTSDGVPVTGVFEVTVAATGIGIVLLVIGLVGLLAL